MFDRLKQWRWLWITVLVLLLDFVSKDLANHYLKSNGIKVFSLLNLTLVHNSGAAVGFLADASGWQTKVFILIAALISALILIWMLMLKTESRLIPIALSLILGGALGNLYDRIVSGVVTDFIDVHYKAIYWPVFNLADSAVTVGVILLMLGLIRKSV
jgi:signal peptidase II